MGLRSRSRLLPLLLLVLLVPDTLANYGTCTNHHPCQHQPDCSGCSANDMVPNPTDCTGFYYCEGSGFADYNPLSFYCPDGEVFDYVLQECSSITVCSPCEPICEYQCSETLPPLYVSNHEDCSTYYECTSSGSPVSHTCPDSTFFDGISCQTDQTRCCLCRLYCDEDSLGTAIIDPLDCRKYHACVTVGDPASSGECPDGTNFEPYLETCLATAECITQCTNVLGEDGCIEPYTCLSMGYFARCPNQCTSDYYHCSEVTDEYVDVSSCGSGTLFDPDTHTCVSEDECPY